MRLHTAVGLLTEAKVAGVLTVFLLITFQQISIETLQRTPRASVRGATMTSAPAALTDHQTWIMRFASGFGRSVLNTANVPTATLSVLIPLHLTHLHARRFHGKAEMCSITSILAIPSFPNIGVDKNLVALAHFQFKRGHIHCRSWNG